MNSKNRNDVTYFLKIEAYVILMCLIFFIFNYFSPFPLIQFNIFNNFLFSWKMEKTSKKKQQKTKFPYSFVKTLP